MKKAFVVLFVVCIIWGSLLACGASDSNKGTLSSGKETKSPQKNDKKVTGQHFKIGDKVKVGNKWEITVHGVQTSNGGQFTKPADGNIYVLVDVTAANISSDESNISSLLNFSLKDGEGRKGKDAVYTEDNVAPAPNGKVAADDKLRGTLIYEVVGDQKKFTLAFEDNMFVSGQTVWDLKL